MPILGCSNSAANKDMISKMWTNEDTLVGWLYWGLNTTLTAKVISWRSVTHMCFLAFSHQY